MSAEIMWKCSYVVFVGMTNNDYFASGMGARYCDQRVCMSVRLHISTATSKPHEIFYTCCTWQWRVLL